MIKTIRSTGDSVAGKRSRGSRIPAFHGMKAIGCGCNGRHIVLIPPNFRPDSNTSSQHSQRITVIIVGGVILTRTILIVGILIMGFLQQRLAVAVGGGILARGCGKFPKTPVLS